MPPPTARCDPRAPPDPSYTEAAALILTYSLTNFPAGDARQRWVLSWERRFLEVMRRFQSTHSQNLSVSFMAEVGGAERGSWGGREGGRGGVWGGKGSETGGEMGVWGEKGGVWGEKVRGREAK